MPIDKAPPPPPRIEQPLRTAQRKDAPIVDMREQFERKTPSTAEDHARARSFIEGKIEMIRRDPHLTDDEKAAAIAELEAKL
jgi:hypothetical protein